MSKKHWPLKVPPLVSIIVRTMPGRGALLSCALRSVYSQIYRPVELILVEDGGDTLRSAITDCGDQGITAKHISCGKVGRCEAGNIGMRAAGGEFLNFLDDDDELLSHHIATLVSELTNRADAVAAYAASFVSSSDIISSEPLVIEEYRRELYGRQEFDLSALWRANQFPIQAVLFRRSLFVRHGGLSLELDAYEDWDLWLRYAAEHDFIYVDAVTSRFRLPASREALNERRQIHEKYLPVLRRRQEQLLRQYARTPIERRLRDAYYDWRAEWS
jgi:glycosyltransferase involved in cell wall biosynthesis